MSSLNIKDIRISLSSFSLSGKRWHGDKQGQLLLIHGWMDNAASFDPLLPYLDYETAIAIELTGHGHSDHRPAGCSYHFSDYVTDIAEFIQHLSAQRFTLIGHSMGGSVAMMLSLLFPERIESLVMIESAGPLSGKIDQEPQRFVKSIKQHFELQNYHPKVLSSLALATKLRMRNTDLTKDIAQHLVQRGIEACEGGWRWRHDKRLTQSDPLYPTEEQVCEFLSKIPVQTLLIEASKGLLAKSDMQQARYSFFNDLTHVVIDGGHHLHMEKPEPVATTINAFLKQGR